MYKKRKGGVVEDKEKRKMNKKEFVEEINKGGGEDG
jgi:hypothetical protein